jgi:hypothetical protein
MEFGLFGVGDPVKIAEDWACRRPLSPVLKSCLCAAGNRRCGTRCVERLTAPWKGIENMSSNEHGIADVVVVGGGSAGAVVAARLSQDPSRSVVLYAPREFPDVLLPASAVTRRTTRITGRAGVLLLRRLSPCGARSRREFRDQREDSDPRPRRGLPMAGRRARRLVLS